MKAISTLRQKQEASKKELRCAVPFSRREFAMMAVIAGAALADADVMDTINPQSRFATDEHELEDLRKKVLDFLDV